MHIAYLSFEPVNTKAPYFPLERPIGRVRVTIGTEQRDGYVMLTRKGVSGPVEIRMSWPQLWPTVIQQHINEPAILHAWKEKRAFLLWARQSFNLWE